MFKFIINFLKILGIACLIGVALRLIEVSTLKKEQAKINEDNNIVVASVSENIENNNENIVEESRNMEQNEIKEAETTEMQKQEEKTEKQEKTNTPKVSNTNKSNIQNENKKVQEQKQENVTTKKEVVTETKQDNSKQEEIQIKQEVKQETKVESKPKGEEYKVNNQMINKIKNIITSNESDDMKMYGYNIVVDSSIVNSTSQFTFTEQRVKDKIKYKFGTIKIYVQDYYNNGEFICTQCYII